jgi:hypothetical protein
VVDIVPGWPPGWRARRDGVHIPGVGVAGIAEIEARAWVWQLVRDADRDHAVAIYDRALRRNGEAR